MMCSYMDGEFLYVHLHGHILHMHTEQPLVDRTM